MEVALHEQWLVVTGLRIGANMFDTKYIAQAWSVDDVENPRPLWETTGRGDRESLDAPIISKSLSVVYLGDTGWHVLSRKGGESLFTMQRSAERARVVAPKHMPETARAAMSLVWAEIGQQDKGWRICMFDGLEAERDFIIQGSDASTLRWFALAKVDSPGEHAIVTSEKAEGGQQHISVFRRIDDLWRKSESFSVGVPSRSTSIVDSYVVWADESQLYWRSLEVPIEGGGQGLGVNSDEAGGSER